MTQPARQVSGNCAKVTCKALVSPVQIGQPSWEARAIPVQCSRKQIEDSPPLDNDAPVSRRFEWTYHD